MGTKEKWKLLHTISGILNSDNHTSGKHELLPRLGQVDDVQAVSAALPDVRGLRGTGMRNPDGLKTNWNRSSRLYHLVVKILGAHVNVGSKHLGPIIVGGPKSSWKLVGWTLGGSGRGHPSESWAVLTHGVPVGKNRTRRICFL